jgi:hypothetical protein
MAHFGRVDLGPPPLQELSDACDVLTDEERVLQTDQSGSRPELSVYDVQTDRIRLLSDPARSASSS